MVRVVDHGPRCCVPAWQVRSPHSGIVTYTQTHRGEPLLGVHQYGRGFFWCLGIGFRSRSNQTQVRPYLDGSEIVVVAHSHLHSTEVFLRVLHTVFKLRHDFARRLEAQTGQVRAPPRLLDEKRINDLLLVFFGALRVSFTMLRTQSFSMEATK